MARTDPGSYDPFDRDDTLRRGEARERAISDAVADYLDRLNLGESIDPDAILAEHSEFASDILLELEAFVDIGSVKSLEALPLGNFGDYTLRREIGRGGMGVVYDAWQESLDRRVALKVLPAGVAADDRAASRLLREARIAAKLSHPNVVSVHGAGVESLTPFYAMEFVEGETLSQFLARLLGDESMTETPFGKRGTVAYFANIADAFAGVAEGLSHAHSKGVVHRDIKPSNLILDQIAVSQSRDSGAAISPSLRILDFGLARLEGQETLTQTGLIEGTLLYMSPEQARRERIKIDYRSDIWSLGASLYEAVTGRPPFRGEDPIETLTRIVEDDPVPPCGIELRVPADLETIILKCLRKDPVDRYSTAEAVAQDLQRFVRGDPIEARPESRWEIMRRRARRSRGKIALALTALFVVALIFWLVSSQQAARREASLATYETEVREAVVSLLAGRFSLTAGMARSSAVFSSLRGQALRLVTKEEVRRILAAGAVDSIDRTIRSLEELTRALPEKLEARYYLARAYALAGRVDDANREIDELLERHSGFVPTLALRWELDGRAGGKEGFAELISDAVGDESATSLPAQLADGQLSKSTGGWTATWLWAHHWFRGQRWNKAADAYSWLVARKAAPFVGSRLESYLRLGVALLESRKFSEAQGAFAVARYITASAGGGLEPALLHAKAYHLGGEEELAEQTIEELWAPYANAREIDGAGDRVVVPACLVYLGMRDFTRALEWARRVADPVLGPRLEASCFRRLHKTHQAVAAARLAMERDPGDPIAPQIAALALLDRSWSGSLDEAAARTYAADLFEFAERAVVLTPAQDEFSHNLLRVAEELVMYTQATFSRRDSMKRSRSDVLRGAAAGIVAATLSSTAMAQIQIGPHKGTFVDVHALGELSSSFREWGPSLTRDGLCIVFGSKRSGRGTNDLWMAKRQNRDERFGDPEPITELNSDFSDNSPNISADGLTIVFNSGRDSGGGNLSLYISVRDDRNSEFGEPISLGRPINTELDDFDGQLSADGLRLYFSRGQPTRPFTDRPDLFVAVRPSENDDWDDEDVVEVFPIDAASTFEIGEINGNISSDDQVLFFTDWQPDNPLGPGGVDIFFASRGGPAPGEFSNPEFLPFPINTAGNDMSPWISYDWPAAGSKLYFVRCFDCSGSEVDIYEATWEPVIEKPVFQRGDVESDGTINITDAVLILNYLFLGGKLSCLDAADTDDNGNLELTDAIYLLGWLFLGGSVPPDPGPPLSDSSVCGPDPTADDLGCVSAPACEV